MLHIEDYFFGWSDRTKGIFVVNKWKENYVEWTDSAKFL